MSRRGLENIKLGFIGIGNKDGAVGFETIPYLTEIPQITQILVTNRNDSDSISAVESFIKHDLQEKAEGERVIRAPVEDMCRLCDLIVLAFETSIGASKKNIPIDYYFRQRCFNSNIRALKESIAPKLQGYDGLLISVTNPPEAISYYVPEIIWGIDRNQVIGFQYVDTERFRKECSERYKTTPFLDEFQIKDKILQQIIKEIRPEGGFVFGEHSPNMIGVFSQIMINNVHRWNSNTKLKELNPKIIEAVRKKGIDIANEIGATGKNAAPSLAKLIEGAIKQKTDQKEIFTGSYFIELEKPLKDWIYRKYHTEIAGLCTGVPIEFYLENAREDKKPKGSKRQMVIRARFPEKYRLKKHSFDFNSISKEEQKEFRECIEISLTGSNRMFKPSEVLQGSLLETIGLKKKEGLPRYLVENDLAVVRGTSPNSEILLIETVGSRKQDLKDNPSILLQQGKDTLHLAEITAMAMYKNTLVVSTFEKNRLLHVIDFPYLGVQDVVREIELPRLRRKQPANMDPPNTSIEEKKDITFMTLNKRQLYLAESQLIQKRPLYSLEDCLAEKKFTEKQVSALCSDDDGVYCGLSTGEIIKFDSNLIETCMFDTEEKSKIVKIRPVKISGRQKIFAMNKKGHLFECSEQTANIKKSSINSEMCCFDIQIETYKNNPFLCIYYANNDCIGIKIDTENKLLRQGLSKKNFEEPIPFHRGYEIKDLIARGDELYVISDMNVESILDKNRQGIKKTMPIGNFGKIKQTGFIKYKK